jgi:hypothetical protein
MKSKKWTVCLDTQFWPIGSGWLLLTWALGIYVLCAVQARPMVIGIVAAGVYGFGVWLACGVFHAITHRRTGFLFAILASGPIVGLSANVPDSTVIRLATGNVAVVALAGIVYGLLIRVPHRRAAKTGDSQSINSEVDFLKG